MRKITIENSVTGKKFAAVMNTQEEINAWKAKHLAKGTWGNEGDLTISEEDFVKEKSPREKAKEELAKSTLSSAKTVADLKERIGHLEKYIFNKE